MMVGTAGPMLLLILSAYIDVPALDFILGTFVMPSGIVWLYVTGMGLFATLAQLYMTKAYGESQAGIVGAVSYTNIVFSIGVGLLLGDALPNFITLLGIILIIVSGILVVKRK
jgi:drug/metabolite transporter (DMT)-like permease